MTEPWVYVTATVVVVCALILGVTLSIIICWLMVYCKHAKVRARKANGSNNSNKWKDSSTLSTVSVETKPRHARTYHHQTFKPNAAMDASGIYIFGVSGTLSGTPSLPSRHGTFSSATSSKLQAESSS